MRSKAMRSNLLLILTAAIWGFAFTAQSVGMEYVGPFTFNATRSFIAAIVLLPVIAWMNRRKKEKADHAPSAEAPAVPAGSRKTMIIGGICCGICLAAASAFQQIGIAYTTVGKAGFLTAMYLVIVPILGLFLGKKARALSWVSVALAVVGLYFLCITEKFTIGLGDTLVLICAFCFSLHILVIDHFSPKVDGVQMSCIQFLTCGILSAVFAVIFETPTVSSMLAAWLPILYAGALSSAVGYTLQIVAQKDTNPVVASLIMSLESVFSLIGGWIILHQHLSGRELLGCLIMFIAIILTQLPERHKEEI